MPIKTSVTQAAPSNEYESTFKGFPALNACFINAFRPKRGAFHNDVAQERSLLSAIGRRRSY